MGWSIAASIGGQFAKPNVPIVALIGDGSMQMHGIEIQTAVRYNLPVIFVVLNNSAHGNPQLRAFAVGEFETNLLKLQTYRWQQFAESLGLVGMTVTDPAQLNGAFDYALSLQKPVLLDVIVGNVPTPTYLFDHYMSQQK